MGRRAADLTTPVSVLCFPALAGVRGWKTTGDKSLLQTWGLQCSVGVQTSPGISKPLTHLPEILSDNISQTFNIARETRSANEIKAILKQKAVETKIKKEVTFRAPGGKASQDVACCHGNSGGTYCYARAIRSNPIIGGTVTRDKPKVKSAVRYINGSVVDSEAIGGIIEENNETERRNLHGNYADHSGESLVLSAGRPFALPPKIHNDFGGRQSEMARVAIHGSCKSAILQQKLEAVEASLEANKDRISILLNIIHDLEMCRTPSSCWRCRDSGQDLKICSTCQKTACIMYSVEYDFRQQERRFLEILSNAAAGNKASSVHPSQHPNFELLRKVLIKNLTKTKLKSKKLCKMLLKWLPRKIQQDGCASNTCTLQI
ncbi:Protein FAM196B [Oryzias melastigma]|uniref:Protein FAM196B n=1 Tax=Oryzias melastigma TaxID=30732 RepID=A0A834CC18_ORYME|nr:Protein FAM196B [Oryzias melastigma]